MSKVKDLKKYGPLKSNPGSDPEKSVSLLANTLAGLTCGCNPGSACMHKLTIPADTVLIGACIMFGGKLFPIGGGGKVAGEKVYDVKAALGQAVNYFEGTPQFYEVTADEETGDCCAEHIGRGEFQGIVLAGETEPSEALTATSLCECISCKLYQANILPGADAFEITIKDIDGNVLATLPVDLSGLTENDVTEETAAALETTFAEALPNQCRPPIVTCVNAGFILNVFATDGEYPCKPGTGKGGDTPLEYCRQDCEQGFVEATDPCATEGEKEERKESPELKKAISYLSKIAAKNKKK